jgi:hypothetical protein
MLRIPHYLDSQLTDGCKVVSLMHLQHHTPQKHFFFCFWYCNLVVRVPGYRSRGLGSIPSTNRDVMGLERGPLNLVSTTEELLERKNDGSGLESREYGHRDLSH